MLHAILADTVLITHLAFILWVALGGIAVIWRPWLALVHLPAVFWGAYVELSGRICPLTPLEQQLRQAAGQQGYSGGFIDHYLIAVIYPTGLTRTHQIAIGAAVVGCNVALYVWVLYQRRRRAR